MELRPGTTQTFELGCNRAFTSYRNPNVEGPLNTYACGDEEPGRASFSLLAWLVDVASRFDLIDGCDG